MKETIQRLSNWLHMIPMGEEAKRYEWDLWLLVGIILVPGFVNIILFGSLGYPTIVELIVFFYVGLVVSLLIILVFLSIIYVRYPPSPKGEE